MKKVIKNNYKIIIGFILGLIVSITTVYAVEAYIESNKVTYNNHNKENVQEAIDELYEKSGVHKNKWVDSTLNGADPVLKEPLIPVDIKPNGEVYYANLNSEWYNYSEKRWANAVILIDNPSNTNYKVGDHIIEDDIESYFVWIPRYQYKIWDLGNYNSILKPDQLNNVSTSNTENTAFWKVAGNNSKLIDIQFGDTSRIQKMSEPTSTGVYYTHPAFTLGDKNLNGIWVGKFETGYKGAKDAASAKKDVEAKNSVIIKPDVYSWRSISAKNIFMTSYNYKRELDSHMMKNTEWGATAYLSHSGYGIGSEININNTNNYKTGYSATANADQRTYPGITTASTNKTNTQPWNSAVGYLASTTGNITGVYDMSGGTWEYMATSMKGIIGSDGFDVSALSDEMSKGYIDEYPTDSKVVSYNKRILGDATGEIGPFYFYYESNGAGLSHGSWYGDFANFIESSRTWLVRGGDFSHGVISGQFAFNTLTGSADVNGGFRLVLAPTK